jgi:hypothetical protein
MDERVSGAASPAQVARATDDVVDVAGDAADQAERLTMIMEAEAARAALAGDGSGEGELLGRDRPLADLEAILAEEDAEDASDDPFHAGGLDPAPWIPAEQAAMHVIDPDDPDDPLDGADAERLAADADPLTDPFDVAGGELTPEDETLLGVDPYERPEVDGDPDDEPDD